jgi:hypothetical protein
MQYSQMKSRGSIVFALHLQTSVPVFLANSQLVLLSDGSGISNEVNHHQAGDSGHHALEESHQWLEPGAIELSERGD